MLKFIYNNIKNSSIKTNIFELKYNFGFLIFFKKDINI